jgi:hypothetical protein
LEIMGPIRETFPLPPGAPSAEGPRPIARAPPEPGGGVAFGQVLQSLGRVLDGGEALVRSAVHAVGAREALGPADLIALQAGVYRYGEAIDLASRLVDRATGTVKTVLQGQ